MQQWKKEIVYSFHTNGNIFNLLNMNPISLKCQLTFTISTHIFGTLCKTLASYANVDTFICFEKMVLWCSDSVPHVNTNCFKFGN